MKKKRAVLVDSVRVSELLLGGLQRSLTTSKLTSNERFAARYMVDVYLSKHLTNTSMAKLESATFKKWQESELLCYHTNVRLAAGQEFSLTGQLIAEMRRLIKGLLGPMPSDYHKLGGFSGGATADCSRGHHLTEKVCKAISCGDNNIIDACYALGYLNPSADFNPLDYCRASQVPKNNRINRMIAIEPTASVYLQKAIGTLIRRRLMRVGVNLDDQTINQKSASRAFSDGLATVDLSAASDSLSLELVRRVIPYDWLRELEKHRSPNMLYRGKKFVLQKFSSMGNGFTFELESLIFWALCKAVCLQDHINVYGDDIIICQSDAKRVIAGLTMIGFQVNEGKSFVSGPFYESCGKHFFRGHDVTPCYQKEEVFDVTGGMRMHNRLIRWALRGSSERFEIIKDACQYIQHRCGHHNCAIPFGVQRDDGWLTNHGSPLLFVDEHGDFRCHVLISSQLTMRLRASLHDIAFRHKLLHFHHLNEDPKGYPGKPGRQAVRRRKVVIWRTSIA